jgi:hypothetical protein
MMAEERDRTDDPARHATDHGELRDKVASRDPAAAPLAADSEAAGTPTPLAEARAAEGAQGWTVQREVKRPDPDRAVSTAQHPGARSARPFLRIGIIVVALVVIAAILTWLSFP